MFIALNELSEKRKLGQCYNNTYTYNTACMGQGKHYNIRNKTKHYKHCHLFGFPKAYHVVPLKRLIHRK